MVLLLGILGAIPYMPIYAAEISDITELKDIEQQSDDFYNGTTPTAQTVQRDMAQYKENSWFQDFEVHFFISLPFTALYSYLSVMSLDAMVQGKFPPDFHQADTWMIIGAAVGSSLAVALGSIDRVPDQSSYQMESQVNLQESPEAAKQVPLTKFELVQIIY
ncbi:hypothetical protein KAR34_07285 [bacterium]|nr:hypothetical protein [bacterium]